MRVMIAPTVLNWQFRKFCCGKHHRRCEAFEVRQKGEQRYEHEWKHEQVWTDVLLLLYVYFRALLAVRCFSVCSCTWRQKIIPVEARTAPGSVKTSGIFFTRTTSQNPRLREPLATVSITRENRKACFHLSIGEYAAAHSFMGLGNQIYGGQNIDPDRTCK